MSKTRSAIAHLTPRGVRYTARHEAKAEGWAVYRGPTTFDPARVGRVVQLTNGLYAPIRREGPLEVSHTGTFRTMAEAINWIAEDER